MDNAQTGSVVNEVPETLKRLILVLAKVFYGPHHYILMDYLQKNVCVKEDRLRDLLKFETRFLRQLLVTLKVDKFIAERQIAEETDGRSRKITYYHVNYKGILNVTKYKIDHIRAKLETREQDNSRKASYVCTGCAKHYEAQDVGKIMNFELNEMICWNCNQKVIADRSSGPSEETRNLMASFNEDMAGIFSMLQQMDGIRFARNILEPAIVKTVDVPAEAKEPNQVLRLGERKFNAGEQTSRSAIYSNGITVSIGEAVEEQIEAKAAVPWLQHTTYDYDNQQATPITGFSSQDLSGGKLTNRNASIDQEPMEVDDKNDNGFSLDQLLNVSRTADIGQLLVEIEGGP